MYFRIQIFILLFSFTVISFSCSKDYVNETIYPGGGNGGTGNGTNKLTGLWDYLSSDVQTKTIQEYKSGSNTHTSAALLDYVTQDNAGKLIIYDTIITILNLSYTISSRVYVYNYVDGVLKDSSSKPMNTSFSVPKLLCAYSMVGDDSVTFTRGDFIYLPTPEFKTFPTGARISFKGDTLSFTENLYKDSSYRKDRKSYTVVQTGTAVINVVKHL